MIRRFISLTVALMFVVFAMAQANDKANRYTTQSLLTTGKWVKIRVNKAGVYSISKSQLSSMGFNNPDNVCLYGYNLPVLPETNIENISDDLTEIPLYRRSDGSCLFYSFGLTRWERKTSSSSEFKHFNNPYSQYVYYFVTEKQGESPKALNSNTFTSNANITQSFDEHAIIENDEYSYINTGRTFYERYDFANGKKKNYSIDLPGICDEKAVLEVRFSAAGTSSSKLAITANDTTFMNTVFYRSLRDYEYGVDIATTFNWNCAKAKSTITLDHDRVSGISGHLDYIKVFYKRNLSLEGLTHLAFTTTKGNNKFKISGANSNTILLCVSSPASTYEIKGTLTDNAYIADVVSEHPNKETYVAINTNSSFPNPEIVGTIENQNLHSIRNVDLVIIVPTNGKLMNQAKRLADAHTAKENLKCAVVRADQVYNEFSSGTPDVTAYRRLMKMLYDCADIPSNRPKNICLFGDGVWDNRMITANMIRKSPDNYLLCYESDNSTSHTDSYVLEEYITLLDDNKGIKPLKEKQDCGIGRITVTTENEAKKVVDKLIKYINNEEVGTWKNTICYMADDGNVNAHMLDAESICSKIEQLFPDYTTRKIYWDSYKVIQTATGNSYINAYNDIVKQVDEGALIMNYTGHGGPNYLSHEQVIKRSDFAEWTSPRLPVWIHAGCDISPFDMDGENNGEAALLNEKGGAIGLITTTRTVYGTQNRKLNINFMTHVLDKKDDGGQYTLGEALAAAKNDIVEEKSFISRDSLNKCHFVLLGDPALKLNLPTYKVKIDEFDSDTDGIEDKTIIGAGSIVNVKGHIVDENGNTVNDFKGTIHPIVFDNEELITCMNNANEDIEPMKFNSRTKKLYTGTDSIKNGVFEFSFPVPLDINYSDESGLLSLYAVNSTHTIEANGTYEDFIVGGTGQNENSDTEGPKIALSFNGKTINQMSDLEDLQTHETPYFIAALYDESGINTIGSGIGHDINLIIDNDPHMTYNLNSYYHNKAGSWKEGYVTFSIPELEEGTHNLLFRAWDNFNNHSSVSFDFTVTKGLQPNIFDVTINGPVSDKLELIIENDRPSSVLDIEINVFDIAGRQVWRGTERGISASNYYAYSCNMNATNGHLTPGIYICKVSVSTSNGKKANKSKKFVVSQ